MLYPRASEHQSDALPWATVDFADSALEDAAKVRRGETAWDNACSKED